MKEKNMTDLATTLTTALTNAAKTSNAAGLTFTELQQLERAMNRGVGSIESGGVYSFLDTKLQADLPNTDEGYRAKNAYNFIKAEMNGAKNSPIKAKFDVVHKNFLCTYTGGSTNFYMSPKGEVYGEDDAIKLFRTRTIDQHKLTDPTKKLVRQYHFKDSFHHIISNNIIATSQYFCNKVTVEYLLDNTWFGAKSAIRGQSGNQKVPAQIDDDIWVERVKEKIVPERNARDIITAWNYALGNLWDEARKMYSGHLTILGDPAIKPNDILMLSDYFTEMSGPIEVEQVTHHFGSDTGFITTIVPNLLCHVNNAMSQGSLLVAGSYMDRTSQLVQDWRGRFSIAGIGIPAIGNWAAGIVFWFTGLSKERREPISLTPLVYAGRPFIAGVEGMRKTSIFEAANGIVTRKILEINRIKVDSKNAYDIAKKQWEEWERMQ
jgi:hypothetical protein